MEGWDRIRDFPEAERNKLRFLVRHAADNGIVEQGVAIRFGNEWRINSAKLPEFLRGLTLATLSSTGRPYVPKRRSAA